MDTNLDVTRILDEDELDYIVKAYQYHSDALYRDARAKVVAPLAVSDPAVQALADYFYDEQGGDRQLPVSEKDRERTLIAVLAAVDLDAGFLLAVHLYWGLAVGLLPTEIAHTLLLTSAYTGLPHWVNNIYKFQTVLNLIKGIIQHEKDECARMGKDIPDGIQRKKKVEEWMIEALSPPAVAAVIRQNFTFATLDAMATVTDSISRLSTTASGARRKT
jgi:hypothetical protein